MLGFFVLELFVKFIKVGKRKRLIGDCKGGDVYLIYLCFLLCGLLNVEEGCY